MSKLSNRLKRASAELAYMEKQLARMEARAASKRAEVEGLRSEVAHLRAAAAPEQAGAEQPHDAGTRGDGTAPEGSEPTTTRTALARDARRTDAIVAVLHAGTKPMSPREITDALHEAGRQDELRSVTATLAHLLKADAVDRVGRGRYLAR